LNGPVEYLDLEDLLLITERLFGVPVPVRDVGLLGAAAARPQTSAFGEDAYPDLFTKAAALLQSILKNHPLVDGNKRLGWVTTAVFLELNGVPAAAASNDTVHDLVITVAAGQIEIAETAALLRAAMNQPR